jgi:cytochrome c
MRHHTRRRAKTALLKTALFKTALLQIAAALALTCVSAFLFAFLGADRSLAAGDAAKGQSAFVRQCAICHTVEAGGPDRFGPNLFGVLHRKAGTAAGFAYSRAFKAAATWDWNPDLVAGWIGAPGVMVPGTAMGVFQGVAQSDRDDIVAYLATQQ